MHLPSRLVVVSVLLAACGAGHASSADEASTPSRLAPAPEPVPGAPLQVEWLAPDAPRWVVPSERPDPALLGAAWPVHIEPGSRVVDPDCVRPAPLPDEPPSLLVEGRRPGTHETLEVFPTALVVVDPRCLPHDGSARITGVLHGGVLSRAPGESLPRHARGMRLTDGVWAPEDAPLAWRIESLSRLDDSAECPHLDLAQRDRVVAAWLADALGTPSVRREAATLLSDVGTANGSLRSPWNRALDPTLAPEDAAALLAELERIEAACAPSPAASLLIARAAAAAQLYEAATARLPAATPGASADSLALRAWLASASADAAASLVALRHALDRDAQHGWSLLLLARYRHIVEQETSSATELLAAIPIDDPAHRASLLERGRIALERGETARARRHLHPLLDEERTWSVPVQLIARSWLDEGNADAARTMLEAGVVEWPDEATLWELLAELTYRVDEDVDEALSLYRRALALDPARGAAWFQLGQILDRDTGDLVGAREAYRNALSSLDNPRQVRAALDLLDALPAISLEGLAGTWETHLEQMGNPIDALVVFEGDQVFVVETPARGPARSWRAGLRVTRRTQGMLELALRGDDGRTRVVRIVARGDDEVTWHAADEPLWSRRPLTRRRGDLAWRETGGVIGRLRAPR